MTQIELNASGLSRRHFLGSAAGLSFAVALGGAGLLPASAATAATDKREIGAWVRIAPDGTVTILTPGAEMGQGSMTGVPVALAEELDADWNKVVLDWAPAEPQIYGSGAGKSMAIVGSRAVLTYFTDMRMAGAQARKVLLNAAAAHWNVPVGELTTEPGVVVHKAGNRRLGYGEIAAFASLPATMPAVSPDELKKKADFRLIGKPVPRRDIPAKVDGSAGYSIDVHVPGMVYASTVHSPVQGGTPESWNDAAVRRQPGVLDVLRIDNGVAVVADTFEHVLGARQALDVVWKTDKGADAYDSETALNETYAAMADHNHGAPAQAIAELGNVDAAFAGAAKVFKQTFRSDYAYHAQMEPLNAVARFNADGTLDIWEGTQSPDSARRQVAQTMGLPEAKVNHHQQYMGGAFGRRTIPDYTIEAAKLAKATGKPVKMIWTREEDLTNAMLRPQNLQCVEAALDGAGKVVGWRHCVVGDGGNLIYSGAAIERYYGVPNRKLETRGTSHAIRLKHWRAVAHPFNLFAIEGLVDKLAAAAGMDPLAFRRERLGLNKKAADVFAAVEAMADWKAKRPAGRALGVAVSERSGSLGAGAVEISLDRTSGVIRVHKVWVAVDGGIVVQPEMARANVESGVVYGISSALKERATVTGGVVDQSNFHDYEVLRMSEAPEEIHVQFLDRDTAPTGLGEIGNPFVPAAVANAFYALTGKRLHHMPFTPERVLAALQA